MARRYRHPKQMNQEQRDAFEIYFHLGPKRSSRKVSDHFGGRPAPNTIRNWITRHKWDQLVQERLDAQVAPTMGIVSYIRQQATLLESDADLSKSIGTTIAMVISSLPVFFKEEPDGTVRTLFQCDNLVDFGQLVTLTERLVSIKQKLDLGPAGGHGAQDYGTGVNLSVLVGVIEKNPELASTLLTGKGDMPDFAKLEQQQNGDGPDADGISEADYRDIPEAPSQDIPGTLATDNGDGSPDSRDES